VIAGRTVDCSMKLREMVKKLLSSVAWRRKTARRSPAFKQGVLAAEHPGAWWRKAWDFDFVIESGVTIAYDGHLYWVESWRDGRLTACFDCSQWREARDQAALEVPCYLAWRQQRLGAQGRCAQIFVPLAGIEGQAVAALLVERDVTEGVVFVPVPAGAEPFSQRVRSAARCLFQGPPDARARAPGTILNQCVAVGIIRDCGHLSTTAEASSALRALCSA
jgi:hypothetical protein